MGFYGYKKFGVLPIATAIVDGGTPINQMPVAVNSVVSALPPIFPRPPLEIQSFMPRSPVLDSKPAMFDTRTAQSFLPPRPVVDVSTASAPPSFTRPTGQTMAFPANPNVEPAKDPSYTGGSSLPPSGSSGGGSSWSGGGGGGGGGYYEEQYLEEPIAGDSAGMQATYVSDSRPLVAAAAGAAGGFALGGPIGAAIGGVLGFLVGKR